VSPSWYDALKNDLALFRACVKHPYEWTFYHIYHSSRRVGSPNEWFGDEKDHTIFETSVRKSCFHSQQHARTGTGWWMGSRRCACAFRTSWWVRMPGWAQAEGQGSSADWGWWWRRGQVVWCKVTGKRRVGRKVLCRVASTLMDGCFHRYCDGVARMTGRGVCVDGLQTWLAVSWPLVHLVICQSPFWW
jgi:hypothetical protein